MTTFDTELSPLRVGRITASRVAAVLGIDPYRSAEDVMREMVRQHFEDVEEFTGNFMTRWGKEHEAITVAKYEAESGNRVRNTGANQITVVHPDWDFLAATPDGWIDDPDDEQDAGLFEGKAPKFGRHVHIGDRPDYRAQLQLQMHCAGRGWADFGIWRPKEGDSTGQIDISLVLRDPDWLERHLPVLLAFRERYEEIINDEDLAYPYRRPLIDVRDDPAWVEASLDYIDLLTAQAALEKALETQKGVLVGLAGEERAVRGGGLLLYSGEPRKPNVDWEKLIKENCPTVDKENYRKTSTKEAGELSWTVKKSNK